MGFHIRDEPDGYRIYEATDVGDMVQYLRDTPRPDNANKESSEPSAGTWNGTRTFEQAEKLALYGWPEGREKLATQLHSASFVKKPALLRCQRLDVAGAYPLVPAAVAGDPMCMVATGMDEAKTRPIVRFLVNVGGLAGISGETMMRRGAAILSWVDHLEQNDMRCEVICIQSNNTRQLKPRATNNVFMAKSASEPLDLDRCAFLLANSAVFRRFIFGTWERDPDICNFPGYGASMNEIHPSIMVPHSVYFPKPDRNSDWETPEMADANVSAIIRNALNLEDLQEAA